MSSFSSSRIVQVIKNKEEKRREFYLYWELRVIDDDKLTEIAKILRL